MTVSLLVADVDGALVNEDKLLTQATLAAVARLDAAGIAFAITSGRPARGLSMLVEPLKLRTPIASFNGGRFVDPDMTVIAEHVLAPDVSRRAVDVMQSQGLDVWVFSGQDWLIHDAAAPYIAHE